MLSSFVCGLSIRLAPFFFFFNDTATTEIYTLSLHDALPISVSVPLAALPLAALPLAAAALAALATPKSITRSEEHTSELQSQSNLVCRLLLEKKKRNETGNRMSRSSRHAFAS